jgi:twinkle protein
MRLRERKLDPALCAALGVWSYDHRTIAFDYRVGGKLHNTKLRREKGNMPWSEAGKGLALWNHDALLEPPLEDEFLIITEGEFDAIACVQSGFPRTVSVPNGAQSGEAGYNYLFNGDRLRPAVDAFKTIVLAFDNDAPGIAARDTLAARLGDERCRGIVYPEGCKDANDVLVHHGAARLVEIIEGARPLWTDELCRLDDIPDPPKEAQFVTGFPRLDHHGLRITLPCFMPVIGPYGSGKSVFVRQLAVQLYKQHQWRFLLTGWEERVKPRFQRDLRRLFLEKRLGGDERTAATVEDLAEADAQINEAAVFLRRARHTTLDGERLLDRIEFAVKVYNVRTVIIDPINAMTHNVPRGMSKSDYLGHFIEALKDLGEDYGLLIVVCAHPPKDALERRMQRFQMLTLNDGADTAHWGNKADLGLAMWRDVEGPTYLHIDKVKDHETMGRPTMAKLELRRALNRFEVTQVGYEFYKQEQAEKLKELKR